MIIFIAMSKSELKEILKARIDALEDESLIQRILEMVAEEGPVYILSKEQIARIEKARQEVAEGKVISNEEAQKEIDEWLKKQG